jgi:predicted transcriptional regulator
MPATQAKPKGKRGPKFTEVDRERVLARLAQLECRCYTQVAMAADVGISQAQVSIYLKEVRERWKADAMRSREEYVSKKIAEFNDIRAEMWQAWERSKEDAQELSEEFGTRFVKDQDGSAEQSWEKLKEIHAKKGRLPASQYITIILGTLKAEMDLLGLTSTINVNNTQNNNTLIAGQDAMAFWNSLLGRDQPPPNPIQARLELEAAKATVPQGHVLIPVEGEVK